MTYRNCFDRVLANIDCLLLKIRRHSYLSVCVCVCVCMCVSTREHACMCMQMCPRLLQRLKLALQCAKPSRDPSMSNFYITTYDQ